MKFVLPTKIDRSKRKSISIVINKDNILIKAPLRASETAIKQVLLNKQAWIEKSITKVQHKIGTQELINSKNIYLQGRPFPVEIDSSIHSLKFATDRFLVSSTSNLEKQVKVFIQNSFHKYLEQKVFF
ncbi:MAG: M48 family metallopeptidase [Thermales bacterium]|nr:M48 family metallopeptidase [Thermales bacterium]